MDDQNNVLGVVEGGGEQRREYRKGNWTFQETMVLIEAKKMDNERRMREGRVGGVSSSRPSEMRWKCIEDYCWRNGCYRSQNQCNDKWDNLMRDYKKVRDHEVRVGGEGSSDQGSYWKLERHERKERSLPTNLLPQIYEALVEVVKRRVVEGVSGGGPSNIGCVAVERQMGSVSAPLPLLMQQTNSSPTLQPTPLPPPPPPPPPHAQAFPTLDSDASQHSSSPERKRRRGEGRSSSSNTHELGSAISKFASILAETLQASDENEERRHKDLLSIEERKAKIEESKAEISVQAIDGLVAAINQLANSVLGLVPDKKNE